jgi:hypothetical protein
MDEKEEDKWTRQGTNVIEIWRLGLKPQWLPTPGELGVSGGSNPRPTPCLSEAVSKKRLSKKIWRCGEESADGVGRDNHMDCPRLIEISPVAPSTVISTELVRWRIKLGKKRIQS